MAERRRQRPERQSSDRSGAVAAPALVGVPGGRFQPLLGREADRIIAAALDILARIGLAGATRSIRTASLAAGAGLRDDGRLVFPRALVEDVIARARKRVELPGFDRARGIEVGGGRVHIGTGGAAVSILDGATLGFRDSTLLDLHDLIRIVEACPHVHYALRPVVARDLPDPWLLDVNTAFATMKATTKPIGTSFSDASHVAPIAGMFDTALGGEGRFRSQPFCFASICHVVPPLRFGEDALAVLEQCIHHGMPIQLCSAGQAGATSPAALAAALAQGLAESLAGLIVVDALAEGFACILGFLPFVSDLRTGAMTGGSGEVAVANAAAAQLVARLGLPSAVSAGMTDAKVGDMQAGYEKGYTVALAAQAGADMINLAVGMLGSITVASPEALVIDDDMCGAILRSVRGIDVREELLDLDVVEAVVTGDGHYLGSAQTLALMKSDYLYPSLGDRQSVDDWRRSGAETVWQRAGRRVRDLLDNEPPSHLPKRAEEQIRAALPIRLPEEAAA